MDFFFTCRIGTFYLTLESLQDCKDEWLDRPLNNNYVAVLTDIVSKDMTAMSNMQPWLAVADIKKDEFTSKDMLKDCNLYVIGGRHRMHCLKGVSKSSE